MALDMVGVVKYFFIHGVVLSLGVGSGAITGA